MVGFRAQRAGRARGQRGKAYPGAAGRHCAAIRNIAGLRAGAPVS
jgi:hypothetical protein